MKSTLKYLLIGLVVVLIGASRYQIYQHSAKPIQTTKQTTNLTQSQNDVLSELVKLTDASNPRANQNYYWQNGQAQLTDDSDMKNRTTKYQDDQGRSRLARRKLTYQMFEASKGSRQGTPLEPANGRWPRRNPKVAIQTGSQIYHGYFYNRSHSIADSLAGKDSYTSSNNFTAGSRTQNVGADQNGRMRAAEETVENYWHNHPNSQTIVHYQTRPVYKDKEKIPRGSIVDIKSDDNVLNVEFVIINDAARWRMDYMTRTITQLS